jgi:hypothetical protein
MPYNELKRKDEITGFYFQQIMGTKIIIFGDLVKYAGLFFHKVTNPRYDVP